MSQPQISIPRELRLDIEALAAAAGAAVTFEPTGGSHWRATITRNGSSRFIIISCTPKPPDVKVAVEPETLSPEQLDDAARDTPLPARNPGRASTTRRVRRGVHPCQ